jgi:hypothetical protein
MSFDGGCDGNQRRAPGGGGGGIAGGVLPANLMDFSDDLLAGMFRSLALEHGALALEHGALALEHGALAFFVSVKLVNRRVMGLMRNRLHAEYQAALHALAYLVPGTRIPCSAASVLPVPSPVDWEETLAIFQDKLVLAPNGLEVGGIFNYHDIFFTETMELDVADDAPREFFLLVEAYWYDSSIYHPPLVSGEGMCDVSRLPNNLRSSMGHLDLTASCKSVREKGIGSYNRFVHVRASTTMQEVFDAISFVEGWNLPAYNLCIADKEIDPDVDVLGSIDLAPDEQWRLVINWPPLSIRVARVAAEPLVIQEHTTICMLQGPVSDMEDGEDSSGVDDNEDSSGIDEHASGHREDKSRGEAK